MSELRIGKGIGPLVISALTALPCVGATDGDWDDRP